MIRRSVRDYAGGALTREELAPLLWAGQGISHSSGKRTVPSPHAMSPLSLYLVAGDVTDVQTGLYRYDSRMNALDTIGHGDPRDALYHAALEDQPWVKSCAALIVIAGDVAGTEEAFSHQSPDGLRGRRYIYMEAGAAAQNITLQAAELGLGCVFVGGFDDDAIRDCLGIETEPLVILPLGRMSA